MKYKARISTGQYEFIEVEAESRDEVIKEYALVKGDYEANQGGLDQKAFNKFVEDTLTKKLSGDPDILNQLSSAQKWWFETTRKGLARIKNKD